MNGKRQKTIPGQAVKAAPARRWRTTVMAAALGLLAPVAWAQQTTGAGPVSASTSGWSFNLAPYLWLPNINSTFNYNLPPGLGSRLPTESSVSPGQIISHMNFAAMLAAEARYQQFSVLSDFVYLNVSNTESKFRSVDTTGQIGLPIANSEQFGSGSRLASAIWTLAGGYTAAQGDWGNLDLIAGFRFFHVNSNTNFYLARTLTGPLGNSRTADFGGTVSTSAELWNGVFGFRGRVNVKDTGFFIPYYFDIGTGGSNVTWQIASGVGYQLGSVGLSVTYRYLAFQQASDAKVKSMTMGGPVLMANFSF